RAIVLVDEYDTPIANASAKGFYADMIEFMRGFLGSVFKTNDHLEFGVLTGVQRVSKESLVSSFNNPKVCGVMDREFAESFGFTEDEVRAACETYDVGDMFDEVKRWYDGYRFGGRDMYNPWSITGYLDRKEFEEYWANTGSMAIFQDVYRKGDATLRDDMAGLLTGAPVTMSVEDGITYPIEYESSDAFWTLLLSAGYIKPCNGARTGKFKAELVNMEIRNLFVRYAVKWFGSQHRAINEAIQKFVGCLLGGDAAGVSDALNKELLNDPSCHDFKEENSYHMFIYGILLAVSDDCVVQSNPETGKGRSDCVIKPLEKAKPAVVLEFKHSGRDGEDLEAEAKRGLLQIDEKGYIHELVREGYERVYKYGIAFHKKSCAVAMEAQG
ncbi:MAG: ATP-binding protein, partial [Oscillospiraceae bacterium]|nr:ATP-binding protein [Oscillospiraceae bacterium]